MDPTLKVPAALLQVDHLHKAFEGKSVIAGASLSLLPQKTVLVVGKSSTGKSTLLQCIAGILHPDGGAVTINSDPLLPDVRRVALLAQNSLLFPYLNVGDNIAFGMRRRGRPESYVLPRVRKALTEFGLIELAHEFPRRLPLEMKMAALVARALSEPAQIFLFDEPLVGAQPEWKHAFLRQIRITLDAHKAASIFASHDPHEAKALGATCFTLSEGLLIPAGGEPA